MIITSSKDIQIYKTFEDEEHLRTPIKVHKANISDVIPKNLYIHTKLSTKGGNAKYPFQVDDIREFVISLDGFYISSENKDIIEKIFIVLLEVSGPIPKKLEDILPEIML